MYIASAWNVPIRYIINIKILQDATLSMVILLFSTYITMDFSPITKYITRADIEALGQLAIRACVQGASGSRGSQVHVSSRASNVEDR